MKKSEVFKLADNCQEKVQKMKNKKLIKNGDVTVDTIGRKIDAWIMRKDGYATNIHKISSVEDFISRTKAFCKNK